MDEYIGVVFHHGGYFFDDKYVGEGVVIGHVVDKDHFSLPELVSYIKETPEMRYNSVGGLFVLCPKTQKFFPIENDFQLLNLIKDLKDGDRFDVYVSHSIDNLEVVEDDVPVGYLPSSSQVGDSDQAAEIRGGEGIGVNVNEGIGVNCNEGNEGNSDEGIEVNCEEGNVVSADEGNLGVNADEDLEVNAAEGNDVNTEQPRSTILEEDINVEESAATTHDNLFRETNLEDEDAVFGEDDLEDIPDEDDSEIDDELKVVRDAAREVKRNKFKSKVTDAASQSKKKQRKKPVFTEEVILGEAGIDKGFEDIGQNKKDKYVGRLGGDEEYVDSSDIGSVDSDEELDPLAEEGVDLPPRRRSYKIRYDFDAKIPLFELGMIFDNATEFRKALADYAIQYKVSIKLRPNEKDRVRAKCSHQKCKWQIFASKDRDSGNFTVKTYMPVHKCPTKNKNKLCTTKYIARKLQDRIISSPNTTVHELQEVIRVKWGLYVGRSLVYRAKMKVISKFMGDWNLEFSRLLDYADIIKSSNPGSSCWVRTDTETEPGKHLFKYFYVCFEAMKKGWMAGCRRIIGFDGCFLKGACKGELLVAVGKNGNNQMYPIAWALVDQETTHSWSWFINYLKTDLELRNGEDLTIMSDMQKGLSSAVADLLPLAERRMCARHIWANWQKTWRGEERRKQFWRCAKAPFQVKLREEMKKMDELGNGICESLLSYDKEYWCRAYFNEKVRCDIVENNMCETFNSWILSPRHKSVITMLEEIRHKMMSRQVDMIKFAETWASDISPMATLVLEENKEIGRKLKVQWNADTGFEVNEGLYRHTVDIQKRECSCRLWQLRGIPCQHAICAFYKIGKEPEEYVEHWYRKDTFLAAYQYFIQPIPSIQMWPDSTNPPIEPPEVKPMPGRPKKCRRKDKDEPKKWGKLSKKGAKMSCSLCHQVGHNKSVCSLRGQTSTQSNTPVGSQSTTTQPAGSTTATQPVGSQSTTTQPAGSTTATQNPRAPSSLCAQTSKVKRYSGGGTGRGRGDGAGRGRGGVAGRGRGRGGGAGGSVNSGTAISATARSLAASLGKNRTRNSGFGLYTDTQTGTSILNPGRPGERVISSGANLMNAAQSNVDLGFTPTGLKWKGKRAMTRNQLQQQMAAAVSNKKKKVGTSTSSAPVDSCQSQI